MGGSIQPERVQRLNDRPPRAGAYVLYWMQQAQRAEFNHALEYAVQLANASGLPLLVGFGLTDGFPEANLRHYTFMLEGLVETEIALAKRRIKMVLLRGDPAAVALRLGRRASEIVCDRGYLRLQKEWRKTVAEQAKCRVTQVESDVVVPVNLVSNKVEFGARTLRPKLLRVLKEFARPLRQVRPRHSSLSLRVAGLSLSGDVCRQLRLDRSVPPVSRFFRGGTTEAKKRFRQFLRRHLPHYQDERNQPQTDAVSHMSKYLHFGQISPLWLLLEARKHAAAGRKNVYTFVDELVVRRELAMNWCEFNRRYDKYDSLPEWAKTTLRKHGPDRRPHVYTRSQIEAGETHDPYWNAAMSEMRVTGYMHNYMRMYWGKKILEWSRTPEIAFQTVLALNNKYFVDGRDPNSFANVAWIFGQHDRPWPERPVFGKVRSMTAGGLERKCDIAAYVEKIRRLARESGRTERAL